MPVAARPFKGKEQGALRKNKFTAVDKQLLYQQILVLNEPFCFYDGSNVIDKIFHPVNLISEFPGLALHLAFLLLRGRGYLH